MFESIDNRYTTRSVSEEVPSFEHHLTITKDYTKFIEQVIWVVGIKEYQTMLLPEDY